MSKLLFEPAPVRYQRNLQDADGYHARACLFAHQGQPASLVFNVASIAIECYLIALCAYHDVMPFNHNYGSLMNSVQEVDTAFPDTLNAQIRALDGIFGICSLEHYHHGTPQAADAEDALAICAALAQRFTALGMLPEPALF